MGTVLSYDDKFATPYSEIELTNGERIVLTLERGGLAVKTPAGPDGRERTLFEGDPDTVAGICLGLVGEAALNTSALQILVAAVTHMPDAKSVAAAFKAAANA
jgi:hypothetical protein